MATQVLPHAGDLEEVALCCKVLISLNAVLELLMATPRGVVTPEAMLAAVEEFLLLYFTCHGAKTMVSKFHSMLHFADELALHLMMLTCWVHERKHRMVRSWCSDIKNTIQFERGVISNTICQHLYELAKPDNFVLSLGLQEPRRNAPRDFADALLSDLISGGCQLSRDAPVMTARVARFSEWGVCATSDCVLVKDYQNESLQVGWVWKHAAVHCGPNDRDGVWASLLQLGDLLSKDSEVGYAVWRLRATPEWCDLLDVVECVAFTWEDATTVRTILPCQFKDF